MQEDPRLDQRPKLRCAAMLLLATGIGQFFMCIAGLLLYVGVTVPTPTQGYRRADPIIVALEQHRQGWGKHPTKLENLVPDFLDQIPTAGLWYEYRYRVCKEGVGYLLYFSARGEETCGFFSKDAEWQCVYTDSSLPRFFWETPCHEE